MSFLSDILKVNDPEKSDGEKYSLSRICLFTCFVLIIVLNTIAFIKDIDISFTIDTLYNLVMLFSAYAFGNKAFKRYQDMKSTISEETINKNKSVIKG